MGQGPLQRDVIAWMLFLFFFSVGTAKAPLSLIIIHQTHYEKSDWLRAFNQFTIACELDMINAISAADIAFIMSS